MGERDGNIGRFLCKGPRPAAQGPPSVEWSTLPGSSGSASVPAPAALPWYGSASSCQRRTRFAASLPSHAHDAAGATHLSANCALDNPRPRVCLHYDTRRWPAADRCMAGLAISASAACLRAIAHGALGQHPSPTFDGCRHHADAVALPATAHAAPGWRPRPEVSLTRRHRPALRSVAAAATA